MDLKREIGTAIISWSHQYLNHNKGLNNQTEEKKKTEDLTIYTKYN